MAVVRAVSTALPAHAHSREDIHRVGAQWLENSPHNRELFLRFVDNSRIEQRHFAIPLETILTLKGTKERAEHFQREGRPLLRTVINDLLDSQDLAPREIEHLIFTSCSSPTIPSIDASVVGDVGMKPSIKRIPVYQHGCAGGVVGLGIAHRILKESELCLLAAVELCSLVYQQDDLSGGNLVGSAIFGDGAAAVLLAPSGAGLRIVDAQSHLVPDSVHLMGYGIEDDGPHLRLDRALPQALAKHAPPFVTNFLKSHGLTHHDISGWLFHPGGVKVLAALESAFSIPRERARWAWDVLERYGNMSSASVLFVLQAFMQSRVAKTGDRICMLGVGPGLTIEAILFEQQ
jgi:alkylresorcinol/alkylpyrone synthase